MQLLQSETVNEFNFASARVNTFPLPDELDAVVDPLVSEGSPTTAHTPLHAEAVSHAAVVACDVVLLRGLLRPCRWACVECVARIVQLDNAYDIARVDGLWNQHDPARAHAHLDVVAHLLDVERDSNIDAPLREAVGQSAVNSRAELRKVYVAPFALHPLGSSRVTRIPGFWVTTSGTCSGPMFPRPPRYQRRRPP